MQVLAIGTGLHDQNNLHWWQDQQDAENSEARSESNPDRAWAPSALSLELVDGDTKIREANCLDDLQPPSENYEAWCAFSTHSMECVHCATDSSKHAVQIIACLHNLDYMIASLAQAIGCSKSCCSSQYCNNAEKLKGDIFDEHSRIATASS